MDIDITSWLDNIGIESDGWITFLRTVIMLIVLSFCGWLSYILAKKWLGKIVMKVARKSPGKWDDLLFDRKFFNRLGLLLAPIVIRITLSSIEWEYIGVIHKIVDSWITVASVMLLSEVFDGVVRIYNTYSKAKDRPIKVFVQVVMIFLWCAAFMVIISIFTSKSIIVLLGGLAAFAAVLMLIFQDSILGFVAGIQLSANNMVRVGDWIVMPNRGVDGNVKEINLTTVKVQNFDKTITTIPTHKLVSESFTNWRGMEESQGRRIKRSISIDVSTIHYLTPREIEKLRNSKLLKNYMEGKLKELAEFNANRASTLDERRLTNVGTFREYLESWIAENPDINHEMTHMVRQLQPGPTGLPLEIYCFSAKQAWIDYENVQSDIFDHIFAIVPLFNLRVFQYTGDGANISSDSPS